MYVRFYNFTRSFIITLFYFLDKMKTRQKIKYIPIYSHRFTSTKGIGNRKVRFQVYQTQPSWLGVQICFSGNTLKLFRYGFSFSYFGIPSFYYLFMTCHNVTYVIILFLANKSTINYFILCYPIATSNDHDTVNSLHFFHSIKQE